MASLGKDLALQPGDQIAVVREGPAGVFREGYAVILSDDNQGISAADASVEVTGPTGPNNNYAVSVKVDPAAGNLITVTPDGVRVDAPAADDNQVISANDASVVVSGPTGINNNYGVAVQIDPAAGNGIALTPTGLRVELANDASTPLADIASLTDVQRGLSLGEVDIPTNRALTVAEMTQANAMNVNIPMGDMQAVFTNRAAEPASAIGMMNADGSPGYYAIVRSGGTDVVDGQAALNETVANYNGAIQRLSLVSGNTISMPAPSYVGQVLHIQPSIAGSLFSEVILDFPLQTSLLGVFRRRDHAIASGGASFNEILLRSGETVTIYAVSATNWSVMNHSYRLLTTNVIEEHSDGKTTMLQIVNFLALITPGDNFTIDTPFAAIITNPQSIQVLMTDILVPSGTALGANGIPGSLLVFTYVHNRGDNTVATMRLSVLNSDPLTAGTPTAVTAVVFNAALDYAALGGVASF